MPGRDVPSTRQRRTPREHATGPTGSADTSLARIWGRIRRPVDPMGALQALVGVPRRTGRQVIGAATAGSGEAERLLAAMPALLRSLSISTTSVPERCNGEIRGPVLWSETLSARAASAGDPGVFVCQTVSRAYDTPENRLLVEALSSIARGGAAVELLHSEDEDEPQLLMTARHNGDLAVRYLDHRTLIDVRRERSRRRATTRLRSGRRARHYRPVLDMLRRAAEPLEPETIRLFCDEVSTARHDLLVAAIDHLESRGVRVPDFLVVDRSLVAGPVRFHHPLIGARTDQGHCGLFIGRRRLDVAAATTDRAGRIVVQNRGDLVTAIDDALASGDI